MHITTSNTVGTQKKKKDLLALEVTNYSSHALLWQIMACFKVTCFFPVLR